MDHPVPATSILPALRQATGDAHQQLEDAVEIGRCLADPAKYRQLLEIFLGFYRPLERYLADAADWQKIGFDFAERQKTPWLEADLHALGLSASLIDRLPDCTELPCADTPAKATGCLYVLEGATLGGRQVSAMMVNSSVPPEARRFFGSYGARTGERWREFVGLLERVATDTAKTTAQDIIRGARETFTCLQHWYVRQCHTDERAG